ncbi:MAG: dihydrofolate reductase family protein [Candidatus Thorarchaeota archaeon]|jgi:dihydrofolate reductase
MANYVYIATSLDGFIATSDGGLDWLEEIPNPEKNDFGYAEFMSGIDAIVMGRKTFEKILTFDFWPYVKPVYVLSKSKINVPEELENKVKIVTGNPKKLIGQLKELGHQNLYIDGGITIQGFLEEDLIDEMIITRVPVLLGNGLPLFGKLTRRLYFSHKRTEFLNEKLVKSYYTRSKE